MAVASQSPVTENTVVTLVCQRCSHPIKLNRSLDGTRLHSAATEFVQGKHTSPDHTKLESLYKAHRQVLKEFSRAQKDSAEKSVNVQKELEKLSSEIELATECFKVLSEASDVDHPLCLSCPEGAMEHYKEEIRLAEEAYDNYRRLLDDLRAKEVNTVETDKIDQELAELKREEEELMRSLSDLQTNVKSVDEQLSKEKERASKLDLEEQAYWEAFNEHQRQVLELRDQSFGTELQLQYTRDQLSRLKRKSVLNTAFYISHNGHFATINGLRFGKLPSVPVEWSEINAAWGQTTFLLSTLANICHFSFVRYKLIPYGSQSFVQDMEGKKKQLPLFTGARLFSDARYDQAMTAFLDCLNQFKQHVATVSNGRFMLPYQIDKDRIGDGEEYYSIKIQFNSEERWTKALKFTLTNIRWAMTWVSANLLDDFSEVKD